jgi:hypothetical protein
MKRQPQEMRQRRLVEGKARDTVPLSSRPQILIRRCGKRQFPELMLCQRLLNGYDAREDLVRFVLNSLCRHDGKPRIIRYVPEKGIGIEK